MKMPQKCFFVGFLLVGWFFAYGCVSAGDFTRSRHAIVQKIDLLERSLNVSGENVGKGIKGLQAEQADKGVEIEALKKRFREIEGALENLKTELANYREIKAQVGMLGDRANQFHNRLAMMENSIATITAKGGGEVVLTKSGNVTLEAIGNDKTHSDMSNLYNKAYRLFKQRRFDRARADFLELLRRFPNSEYSADATFWIAETYFLEKENEKAILEYEKIIKEYPDSNKIHSALLKQGMAFARIGDTQSAQIIFKRIIQAFPNTAQAHSAQQQLNEIK